MIGPCKHERARCYGLSTGVGTYAGQPLLWCDACGALGRKALAPESPMAPAPIDWLVMRAPSSPPAHELAYAAGLLTVVMGDQPVVRRVRDWLCSLADVELGDGL